MSLTSHAQARDYAREGFRLKFGRDPNESAVKVLAGIAFLETNYSNGWALTKKDPDLNPKNQGAIQCGSGWRFASFAATDTHPNADGTNTRYPAAFRLYREFVRIDSAMDYPGGWDDLAQVAFSNRGRSSVLEAALAGDVYKVSALLHSTGYYEGWGPTVAVRVEHHFRALCKGIVAADRALGLDPKPLPSPLVVIPPTLAIGARDTERRGPVWRLQIELPSIVADGDFGKLTRNAVEGYQVANGLPITGKADALTWEKLLTDDYIPPELAA